MTKIKEELGLIKGRDMLKNMVVILLAFWGAGLWADTVMVETVGDVPADRSVRNSEELLAQMETGAMESLFDGGHLFFNMTSSSGSLTDENTDKVLLQSRRAGAQWLIRLIPNSGEVGYHIYDTALLKRIGEGIVLKEDFSGDLSWEQFYFEAGKEAGQVLISLMGKQ